MASWRTSFYASPNPTLGEYCFKSSVPQKCENPAVKDWLRKPHIIQALIHGFVEGYLFSTSLFNPRCPLNLIAIAVFSPLISMQMTYLPTSNLLPRQSQMSLVIPVCNFCGHQGGMPRRRHASIQNCSFRFGRNIARGFPQMKTGHDFAGLKHYLSILNNFHGPDCRLQVEVAWSEGTLP